MRVVSGSLGGRQFSAPAGHRAHPMSEQIRNALFNALGDITGLSFLDAYAGSGGVAFEAASRGAGEVYAIEKDPRVFKTLKANRDLLQLGDSVSVSRANCTSWVGSQGKQFSVIVADPPFDLLSKEQIEKLINYLVDSGTFVLSHQSESGGDYGMLQHISTKPFGNAALSFYRRST